VIFESFEGILGGKVSPLLSSKNYEINL